MEQEMKQKIDCETCLWAQRSGGCMRWGCEYIDKHEAYEAWKEKHEKEEQ